MGIKRFLVAGSMASLVLIGVVLVDDAKSIAQTKPGLDNPSMRPPDDVKNTVSEGIKGVDTPNPPSPPDDVKNTVSEGIKGVDNPVTFPVNVDNGNTARPQAPSSDMGAVGTGGGGMAPGAGGAGGTGGGGMAPGAGGAGGTGGGGGAGGALVMTMTDLPDTGGPSVVLLLASALLLGSALVLVAIVRSVRS